MKPSPQQIQACRDALNRIFFLFENGQIEKAVDALDHLGDAMEAIDVKAKPAAVTTPPPPDSGAWQEAK